LGQARNSPLCSAGRFNEVEGQRRRIVVARPTHRRRDYPATFLNAFLKLLTLRTDRHGEH